MTADHNQAPAEGDEPVAWQVAASFWQSFASIPEALRAYAVPLYSKPQPKGTETPARDDKRNSREYYQAMGDWLGAVGDLIEAMGRPKFEADTPVAVIAEAIREAAKRLADLQSSLDVYKRRCDALQACQSTMRDPERTMVCDILANGSLLLNGQGKMAAERYAVPAPKPGADEAVWRCAADARLCGRCEVCAAPGAELTDDDLSSLAAGPWWSEDGVDPVRYGRAVIAADRKLRAPAVGDAS